MSLCVCADHRDPSRGLACLLGVFADPRACLLTYAPASWVLSEFVAFQFDAVPHARRVLWCALRFTVPPNPPTQSMTIDGFRVFIEICGRV